MSATWIRRCVIATCVAAGLAPCVAVAQVTWTGTTGNGDWSTAGAFAGSSGALTLANNFSQPLVFAGTPAILSATNTLTGGTATSLTFNSGAGAYTLSGSAITLSGNITNSSTSLQTINLPMSSTANRTVTMTAGGGNVTLGGPLSGAGGYILAGSGTLRLTGSNSYGGNTSIGAGSTLVIGDNNALGKGQMTTGGNGFFDVTSGSSFTIQNNVYFSGGSGTFNGSGNLAISGTFQFGGGNRRLGVTSGTLTLATIDAAGTNPTTRTLTKAGNGTLVVTGAAGSDFQGGMTLEGGLTIFGNSSAMGQGLLVLGSGTMSSIGNLTISNTTNIQPSSATTIAGTSSITFTGPFSNGLSGARSVTNNLDRASAVLTFSGPVSLSAGGPMTFGGSGNTTFSGTISGVPSSGNALSITSTGTTTLSAANTYSGTTRFNSLPGSLVLGNDAALGSSVLLIDTSSGIVRASTTLTATNAVAFNTDTIFGGADSMTFGAATNVGTSARQVTNNLPADKTLTFTGTTALQGPTDGTGRTLTVAGSGNTTFTNTIVNGGTAGNGGLTINSTGTTTLQAANSYTGVTTVNAGVLMLSNTGALGSGNLRLDAGGVVALDAGDFTSGTGSGAGQVRIVTSGGFAAFGAERVVAFGGTSAPSPLTWGDGVFVGSSGTFVLGAPGATATLDFRNAVALGSAGTTRVVQVNDGPAVLEGTMSGVLSGAASLRKTGPGALRLSATNTFTGTASIGAGVLEITATTGLRDAARVVIDGGATFRYAGVTGTFAKPITVTAGSGTGTIQNSGGGTLTLSGAISKDNSVLRLTGGVFDVTGVISGATVNASDLLVDGTATVTLSAVNTYNGPTFVNQSSNLIVGITNAIPNNSVVALGNATTTGTLTVGSTVSNAIGGLAFGSAGGTLRLATTSTSAAPLTASSGTLTLTNGTLDLAGSGSTAGIYRVLSGGTVAGAFASVTGTIPAYRVIYSGTSVDYQQRAVFGAVAVTNTTTAIITGGSAAFTYTVANTALSGGAALSFTGTGLMNVAGASVGSALAGGTSSAVAGLFFAGATPGLNQIGTFSVSDPDAFVTTATGSVSMTVLDHALPGFVPVGNVVDSYTDTVWNIDFGSIDESAGMQTFNYFLTNLSSIAYGQGLTAGLDFTNVTADGDGFSSGLSTFSNLTAGGTSSQFAFTYTPSGQGTFNKTFTLTFYDNQSLAGATQRRDLTINASVVVVPEPATLALAAAGIGMALVARARRRRAA